MNLVRDHFRLHAYVDGELTSDEVAEFERQLAEDPGAMADVAALRAQKNALHAGYDGLLSARSNERVARIHRRAAWPSGLPMRGAWGMALAASLLVAVGGAAGWLLHGRADGVDRSAGLVEGRLQAFVQTAALSHAVFVPEVRHPVEVPAAEEAHLVAWLSKRLAAPLVVPNLGDAGWTLLGGRLLPAESGPVAQFMYQDASGRRMTLAVSHGIVGTGTASSTSFRMADEGGDTVFYWLDRDYAYALTGKLSKAEMTGVADRVYRQLERANGSTGQPPH
jgi:anti-sigma factor RsiW